MSTVWNADEIARKTAEEWWKEYDRRKEEKRKKIIQKLEEEKTARAYEELIDYEEWMDWLNH